MSQISKMGRFESKIPHLVRKSLKWGVQIENTPFRMKTSKIRFCDFRYINGIFSNITQKSLNFNLIGPYFDINILAFSALPQRLSIFELNIQTLNVFSKQGTKLPAFGISAMKQDVVVLSGPCGPPFYGFHSKLVVLVPTYSLVHK